MNGRCKLFWCFALALCGLFLVVPPSCAQHLVLPSGSITARFSPDGGVLDAIVSAIDGAKSRIRMQLYIFTSKPSAQALARAKARGVDVEGVMDGEQAAGPRSKVPLLVKAGVLLHVDNPKGGINHNKVFIIDDSLLIMGSYNMQSKSEKRNAENVLFIHSPELARAYLKDYARRKSLSQPLPPGR